MPIDPQRCLDLLRYMRHELLTAELITCDEFTDLLLHEGAVPRLEAYDKLRKQNKELKNELTVLKTALAWYRKRHKKCPTCDSHAPALHPTVQLGGEVQPCSDPWHVPTTSAYDDSEKDKQITELAIQLDRLQHWALNWHVMYPQISIPDFPDVRSICATFAAQIRKPLEQQINTLQSDLAALTREKST